MKQKEVFLLKARKLYKFLFILEHSILEKTNNTFDLSYLRLHFQNKFIIDIWCFYLVTRHFQNLTGYVLIGF